MAVVALHSRPPAPARVLARLGTRTLTSRTFICPWRAPRASSRPPAATTTRARSIATIRSLQVYQRMRRRSVAPTGLLCLRPRRGHSHSSVRSRCQTQGRTPRVVAGNLVVRQVEVDVLLPFGTYQLCNDEQGSKCAYRCDAMSRQPQDGVGHESVCGGTSSHRFDGECIMAPKPSSYRGEKWPVCTHAAALPFLRQRPSRSRHRLWR